MMENSLSLKEVLIASNSRLKQIDQGGSSISKTQDEFMNAVFQKMKVPGIESLRDLLLNKEASPGKMHYSPSTKAALYRK